MIIQMVKFTYDAIAPAKRASVIIPGINLIIG